METSDRAYCGVIFIGGGSSWHWGKTPGEAAKSAAKVCRQDWGAYFDMKGKALKVNILDMSDHEGWVADHRGIRDSETGEVIEVSEVIEVPE